jgi:hypothetical protein
VSYVLVEVTIMMPFTATDLIRRAGVEARSALPDAPVVVEITEAGSRRFDRARLGLGLALRWLADRIEPACRPAPVHAGGQTGAR